MSQCSGVSRQDLNQAARGDEGTAGPILGFPTQVWREEKSDAAIRLDSCVAFERIAVKTQSSLYEVIVLCGRTGEVLIRGGRFFPEFRRAILTGSTAGGSALKLRTIDVGLRIELRDDLKLYTTTAVEAVSREESTARCNVAAQVP